MKRIRLMTMAGAIVLFLGATSSGAASESPPSASGTARVESADPGGDLPARTAEVSSADYVAPSHQNDGLPAIPLVAAAVLGAGLVAAALFARMRRNSHPPAI